MKCICGYEQEEDFEEYVNYEPVDMEGKVCKKNAYPGLYFCPKCGTVKVKVETDK